MPLSPYQKGIPYLWTRPRKGQSSFADSSSQQRFDHCSRTAATGLRHPVGEASPGSVPHCPGVGGGALRYCLRAKPDTEDGPVHTTEIVRVVDGRRNLSALF